MIADGAVRSVQAAELTLPHDEVEELWTPVNLERLARTYWRFLTRVTLGLIRVHYTERERFVVLLFRPFVLLSFQAPEYEMDADRGVVRWRIEKGVLVVAARPRRRRLPARSTSRAGRRTSPAPTSSAASRRGRELLPRDRLGGSPAGSTATPSRASTCS